MIDMKIQPLAEQDIEQVAEIGSVCFSGLSDRKQAREWVTCNFRAFPRMRYFIAKQDDNIAGYILWIEKGGFRERAVLELEQIAVRDSCRGDGIGCTLIEESLRCIQADMEIRGSRLKLVEVTTGTDNQAQELYRKALDAKPECTIKDLFRGDEVVMIARMERYAP